MLDCINHLFMTAGFPGDLRAERRSRRAVGDGWQTVHHGDDETLCGYFLFYRWGLLPALELYFLLKREMVEKDYIMEKSVDGMEFVAAAYFTCAPFPFRDLVRALRSMFFVFCFFSPCCRVLKPRWG